MNLEHTSTDANDPHDNDTRGEGDLPPVVHAFLQAHRAHDADTALRLLTPDAVISDVGEAHSGKESLRRFIATAGTEFAFTTEVTGVRRDGGAWVVGHHLAGDFPGGTADLDYRFLLAADLIARLDIVLAS
ncbi:nuclear transport factor 2 family protein [Nocardioides sp.]|uniref:nuclear transport factor 2 family protein n=1 Tax=Nocardioides sp. TaxID=35761 RepID=UPI003516A7C2